MQRRTGEARRPEQVSFEGRGVLSRDTEAAAEQLQVALWRGMSPLEKLKAVSRSSLASQELALEGIRRRHPRASLEECRLRLAIIKLGRALALEAYPRIGMLEHP